MSTAATPSRPVVVAPLPPGRIDLVRGFKGPIEPIPVGKGYVASMVLVAIVLVLLPLVYIAMIAGVGWLIYLHAVTDVGILGAMRGRRSGLLALAVYIGPMIAGGIAMLFMIKPLFAPRGESSIPQTVVPRDQPLLFAYVERLCEVVGAPVPREIAVDGSINASAGFRRGLWSLFTNDLRLTIGLPLAASMDLRCFTGVLAHELGHFSQGFAMRVSFLIRVINNWFLRVAYERDAWDYGLERAQAESGHIVISIVVGLARLSVWLSRRVLICLAFVAHALSSFLSKQMEYDADLHEIRVSGTPAFTQTCRRISELGLAWETLGRELRDQVKQKRIPDDLMAMTADCVRRLPPEQSEKRFRIEVTRPSHWYESHPSTSDRIRAAEAANDAGVLLMDAPASELFKNFGDLCRQASYNLVRDMFDSAALEMTFVPAAEYLKNHRQEHAAMESAAGVVPAEVLRTLTIRPVFLRMNKIEPPSDIKAIADRYARARQAMKAQREAAKRAAQVVLDGDSRIDQASQFTLLLRLGLKPKAADFGLKTASQYAAETAKHEALSEIDAASAELESFTDALRERVTCNLRLLADPSASKHIPRAGDLRKECDGLLTVNAVLAKTWTDISELRRRSLVFEALASRLTGSENVEHVKQEITATFGDTPDRLRSAHEALEDVGYPFPHDRAPVSIARAFVPELPPAREIIDSLEASRDLSDGHAATYRRTIARLIEVSQTVEASLKAKAAAAAT